MWKEYSKACVRGNKPQSAAIAVSAFVSATFLTLITSLFYNIFMYDAERGRALPGSLLVGFYAVVITIACLSVVLIIKNAFAVPMNARIRQFGVLQSVGATPKQIKSCLVREALLLTIAPILAGSVVGTLICPMFISLANGLDVNRLTPWVFRFNVWIWLVSVAAGALTALFSAWIPARRVSGVPIIKAIRAAGEPSLRKRRRGGIAKMLFGVKGELAGNSLAARKKQLRVSTVSLTLSMLAFSMFLCFITLSTISTKHTYFERYKDRWDVLATADADVLSDSRALSDIARIDGVLSVTGYKRTAAKTKDGADISLVIMDDAGYAGYLGGLGLDPQSGCVLLTGGAGLGEGDMTQIAMSDGTVMPVAGVVAGELPLREALEKSMPNVVAPVSMYKGELPGKTKINVLAKDGAIDDAEREIGEILASRGVATENRPREQAENDRILDAYMTFMGAICCLFAAIGVANVFTGCLGFVAQRRREFARYLSLGVTPAGLRGIMAIEALWTVLKPAAITVLLTAAFVVFAANASNITVAEFMTQAPVMPIATFMLAIAAFVTLAYVLGGRKILKGNIVEALKDDSMI